MRLDYHVLDVFTLAPVHNQENSPNPRIDFPTADFARF